MIVLEFLLWILPPLPFVIINVFTNTRPLKILHKEDIHLSVISLVLSGLGVENTKNRLQYIYPTKHSLIINDTEKEYSNDLE